MIKKIQVLSDGSESCVNQNTWYGIGVYKNQIIVFMRKRDPVYQSETGPIYFAVRRGWDK